MGPDRHQEDSHQEEPGQISERGEALCADKAEAKRRELRRRFLLGGLAIVPIITTINPRRAFAASELVCASIPHTDPPMGEASESFVCVPF